MDDGPFMKASVLETSKNIFYFILMLFFTFTDFIFQAYVICSVNAMCDL